MPLSEREIQNARPDKSLLAVAVAAAATPTNRSTLRSQSQGFDTLDSRPNNVKGARARARERERARELPRCIVFTQERASRPAAPSCTTTGASLSVSFSLSLSLFRFARSLRTRLPGVVAAPTTFHALVANALSETTRGRERRQKVRWWQWPFLSLSLSLARSLARCELASLSSPTTASRVEWVSPKEIAPRWR